MYVDCNLNLYEDTEVRMGNLYFILFSSETEQFFPNIQG